jgi:hypothetical protein
MSKDTMKYMGEIISTRVENILYFIYFLNQGSLRSMVGGTLEDVAKAPKKIILKSIYMPHTPTVQHKKKIY